MTITKNAGRQGPVVAHVDIDLEDLVGPFLEASQVIGFADLTSAASFDTDIELPAGAVVVGGYVYVDQAFNSGTSDTLIVGDASDDNRYLTAGDLQVLAPIALLKTGFIVTGDEPILTLKWTKVGASPTAGRIRVVVQYYVVADIVTETVNVLYSELTSGSAFSTAIAMPEGAVLIGGKIDILTAFNSQTSDVVVVGDATVANRYVASTDIHTGAATPIPFVPTGFVATDTQPVIKLTWTKVGTAPSAGALALTVSYYVVRDLVALRLPKGAQVVSGGLTVLTALDSGTSDTVSVGDASSPSRYKSAGDAATLGRLALVPTGHQYDDEDDITLRWIRLGTTAPTECSLRLDVKYLREGRTEFTQE